MNMFSKTAQAKLAKAAFKFRAAGIVCRGMTPEKAEDHFHKLVKKHGDPDGDAKDEFLFGYYGDLEDNYPYRILPKLATARDS